MTDVVGLLAQFVAAEVLAEGDLRQSACGGETVDRPNGYQAARCAPPDDFEAQLKELGLGQLVVPEKLGGAAKNSFMKKCESDAG